MCLIAFKEVGVPLVPTKPRLDQILFKTFSVIESYVTPMTGVVLPRVWKILKTCGKFSKDVEAGIYII